MLCCKIKETKIMNELKKVTFMLHCICTHPQNVAYKCMLYN